ncbi:hypothetical protein [Pyrococcus kukulkanii]|uniref:hypothetical protein n=1 Tax=Pyrococcus kukulkanii TaxID=1609559 RepID=UPI003567EB17
MRKRRDTQGLWDILSWGWNKPRNIGTAILEGKRVAGEIEEWLITHAPRRLLPPTLAGRLIAEVIEGKC